MAGTLNIIDLAKGYLTGDVKNKLSSFLGESGERTQSGLDAAVPGLLSGLDNAASTSDGSRRLSSAVDNADEGILSNIGSLFGKGTLSDFGLGPLQSILGMGGLSDLTSNIGRASGLTGKSTSTIIGFLVPIVFGMLKKLKQAGGLDASGLSSLLAGQRSNIAAAMPEAMRESSEETYGTPRAVPHARVTETYTNVEPERRKSSLGWVLPLAMLAGLLGLIWYGATRTSVRAGRDDNGLASQTAREQMNVGNSASFDALRTKYQSVIDVARTEGVQISNLTGQDGKLILQGTAPSLEAANKVWDAIKQANPGMDDIVADIKVAPSSASSDTSTAPNSLYSENGSNDAYNSEPSTKEETPTSSDEALPRAKPTVPESLSESDTQSESATQSESTHEYVVKPGDTLSTISKQFYGNTRGAMRIFNENSSQLKSPNSLEVGQTLEIPMK